MLKVERFPQKLQFLKKHSQVGPNLSMNKVLIIRETVRFALLDTKNLSKSQECQNLETHFSGQIIVGHPKLVLLDQGVCDTLGMVPGPSC